MSADPPWDITELGRQGGESFSADYLPGSGVVRISGPGIAAEEFPVDADQWQQQAARELAVRGYGARWTRWEAGPDGTQVMSTARTRFPDTDQPRPVETAPETETDWEAGAAHYSAAAAERPESAPAERPESAPLPQVEYGRVRVYPQYIFPVYQSGPGGIGVDQQITVTDWDKQGRTWAEAEARRQVTDALGAPADDAPGGPWWMGRPEKDAFRWQPVKGTPRTAKPNDGHPEPQPWQPWRASETAAETGTDPVSDDVGPYPEGGTEDEQAAWRSRKLAFEAGAQIDREHERAAAAGTPYVEAAHQVQAGDRVLDTENGELATVTGTSDYGTVAIKYDGNVSPDSRVLRPNATPEALQMVPRDSTYASLEDRRPPAEQAERYAERKQHHLERRGDGKRAKNGYPAHAKGCRVCADIDAGGDGAGRRMASVRVAPPAKTGPGTGPAAETDDYPVRFTFTGGRGTGGEAGEIRHWAFEASLDALRDHVGAWTIPDDGTGVLDTDALIASIGGYIAGVAAQLAGLADRLGGGQTPIAAVVGEVLDDFAASLTVMAGEAGEAYRLWTENDDNAHDLRRARGEIPRADLFNVA